MHILPRAFFKRHRLAPGLAGLDAISLSLLFTLLLLITLPSHAFGQGATATLTGTVTDPQGAVAPRATVTVSGGALGIKRQTTTNGEGNYTVAQLPPSVYSVKVEASGFAVAEITDLILQVGQQAAQNVSLAVKSGNETVIIKSGGQVLTNTQNAEIGSARWGPARARRGRILSTNVTTSKAALITTCGIASSSPEWLRRRSGRGEDFSIRRD